MAFLARNIGDADRTARLLAGATLGFLYFRVTGTSEWLLGLVTVFLLATSLLGWCPVYALLRISTVRPTDAPAAKQ